MLEKSHSLEVDCAVYDLEDSVAEDKKASARVDLRRFLDGQRPNAREIAVRINGVDTVHALADMTEVLSAKNVDAIVIPKVQTAGDIAFVEGIVRQRLPERNPVAGVSQTDGPPAVRLLPLIESAKGMLNLADICAASPYISAVVFAAEDFTLDLGITRTIGLPELQYARSKVVLTARACGITSIVDLVCTSYKGSDGQRKLEEESVGGKNLGFTGKQCIHPAQVEIVQKTFAPSDQEVEWAVRVVVADEKARQQGRGAWSLDGKMIDVPVAETARSVVAKAERCGVDVGGVREKFAGQEPE